MKRFDWDDNKNERLKRERGVSFEEVVLAIENGSVLDTIRHPNKARYPSQSMFIVNINMYAYLAPFVEDEEKVFLKTIIPSRKATKKYLIERKVK